MKQDTQAWLETRKNYIGASDAPILMNGEHFGKTPFKLWQEKLGLATFSADNAATRYGKRNEEPARMAYEKLTGEITVPEVVFSNQKTFMMASLDGINLRRDIVLEIKNPCAEDHELAESGKVPEKYFAQLQHQMFCAQIDMVHYFSFRSGRGVLVEVKKDSHYIDSLLEKESNFWEHVLNFDPPALTSKDYRNFSDNLIWREEVEKLQEIQIQLDRLNKEKEEYKNKLIELAEGQNAEGFGLKLRQTVRKGAIDYKKVPELEGVDLEKYRKKSIVYWTCDLEKN